MKSKILLFILSASVMLLSAMRLSAFEWPVTELALTRNFAQRSEGVIEQGLSFEKTETVRAAGHGMLLLTLAQNRNMDGFPGTLGNAIIIAHEDGLLSIYGNLDNVDRVAEQIQIDSLSQLAATGKSGWGHPNNFIFQVVDRLNKNMLNPLLLLPPLKDTHGASIQNIVALDANGQIFALGSAKSVKQGKYRIYAKITDTIDGSSTELNPFRVSLLVNGRELLTIPFELLKFDQGKIFLSSPVYTWETLYSDSERMFLGEISLTRGRSDISIIARDIAGNERSVLFGLQID